MESAQLDVKNSFHVLPVQIPDGDGERFLYFREHKTNEGTNSSESRTIYVKDGITLPFEAYGFALVTFETSKGVKNALKKLAPQKNRVMRTRDQKAQCGFSAWLQNHIARRSIDPDAMQRSVDNFMRKYDQRVREQEKQKELESTTVDSEGWTKVTRRGGRLARQETDKGPTTVGTATLSQAELMKRREEKLAKVTHDAFYKHQKFQKNQQYLMELQKRFEEDKLRVLKLKENRKFKPF